MAYSVEERELVRPLGMNGRRALLQCKENFMQNTGRTKRAFAPSGPSIRKWHEMLVTTGSVQETPRRRSQPIRSPENVTRVLDHFTDNPHSSLRRAASTLGMSHASVQRMLRTSGWHPYKVHVVQKLHDEDYANRIDNGGHHIEVTS